MNFITLNNGVQIPSLGFGTWRAPEGETTVEAVKTAIELGYTLIDGAAIYKNEASVGKGIKASGAGREKLFITSKLWNTERGYESTLKAFDVTLRDLQLDYLDLYLIHWPASSSRFSNWAELNAETWRAFEELHRAGKIRALGLSNFLPHHMDALLETASIPPAVNQIEYHPGHMQEECVNYCREKGIVVESWGPLGAGKMLDNPSLKSIASKYGKSVAQLCIRWVVQHGHIPLPKSVNPGRIKENTEVFDFEISSTDMQNIDAMEYFGGSGLHPDKIEF